MHARMARMQVVSDRYVAGIGTVAGSSLAASDALLLACPVAWPVCLLVAQVGRRGMRLQLLVVVPSQGSAPH
jgi:hypothetical protein